MKSRDRRRKPFRLRPGPAERNRRYSAPVIGALDLGFGDNAALVRVDYSSDHAWSELLEAVTTLSEDGFVPYLQFVDDAALNGLGTEGLRTSLAAGYGQFYVFVADGETFSSTQWSILVLDLHEGSTAQFRTTPSGVQSIDNNLSIANMDFAEFARQAELQGGLFRGF